MLPAKKQGSLALYVENESQTKTFVGEVVEGNTGAGTCLVRISGGRVQTCDVPVGAQLSPKDKVYCTHMPGHVRLVANPSSGSGMAGMTYNQLVALIGQIAGGGAGQSGGGGGGGGGSEIQPPGLSAPTNLTATTLGQTSIQLNWSSDGIGVTYFHLERSLDGTSFSLLTTLDVAITTYVDDQSGYGLDAGTQYWYRVRAVNSTAVSLYSNIATATTDAATLTAPTSLTALDMSDTEIKLDWLQAVTTGVTHFQLFYSLDNVIWTYRATVVVGVLTYLDTGLTASTPYWYKVRAVNADLTAVSPYSNVATATTKSLTLSTPTGLTAIADSDTEIDLDWTIVGARVSWTQLRRSLNNTTFAILSDTVTAPAHVYADTGLAAGTPYWYYVRTVNTTEISPPSNTATDTTKGLLGDFPVTGILDNFNRADEGPPPSSSWHTPFYGVGVEGLQVAGNVLVNMGHGSAYAYWDTLLGPNCEVYCSLPFFVVGAELELYARSVSNDNWLTGTYTMSVTVSQIILFSYISSAETELGRKSLIIASGDSVGLSCVGTTITAWHKPAGGSWAIAVQVTDAGVTGTGYIGIKQGSLVTYQTVDNFGGGTTA